jgi:SAM-dependent methyltransferase
MGSTVADARTRRNCPFAASTELARSWHEVGAKSARFRDTWDVAYMERPELYDLVYSFKDYEQESTRVVERVRARSPEARTLLDVACGTGQHLAHLRNTFTCEGVDLDDGLLEIARARLPDVPLHLGDMRTFDLGRRFDVVTCLFSAIGFALDLDGLAEATARLADHVAPGGVLLVEPWITPGEWIPGRPDALTAQNDEFAVARMAYSGQDGRLSWAEMEYLVSDGTTIEHFTERQELGLFTNEEMLGALEATGLAVEHDVEGLIGRGLYVGVRH